jgi:hypothetical protein
MCIKLVIKQVCVQDWYYGKRNLLDSILNIHFKGSLKSKPYISVLQSFLFMLSFMTLIAANCVSKSALCTSHDKKETHELKYRVC